MFNIIFLEGVTMKRILINEKTYEELVALLEENDNSNFRIRISFINGSSGGPIFSLNAEEKEDDFVEIYKNISFYINKDLITEFGGFTILSSFESSGTGISLRPHYRLESGCTHCEGCH